MYGTRIRPRTGITRRDLEGQRKSYVVFSDVIKVGVQKIVGLRIKTISGIPCDL